MLCANDPLILLSLYIFVMNDYRLLQKIYFCIEINILYMIGINLPCAMHDQHQKSSTQPGKTLAIVT